MRLLKVVAALVVSLGLIMGNPTVTLSKEVRIGEISMADCNVAGHFITVIYDMAKVGRGSYEIMAYLDSITDDTDREYVGILMTKVNVTNVQLSVRKAYTIKKVMDRHMELCVSQIGNDINRY